MIIENQRPHFNTLPRQLIVFVRIGKCSVRDSPCTSIVPGVITFDQRYFVRGLAILEVPAVGWVGFD